VREKEPFPSISVRAVPLREQVVDAVRDAILDFRIKPGQRLVERELVERMGVSRATIREVLRQLTAEGLVTIVPQKGSFVVVPSMDEVSEVYAIRGVLEAFAARQFVEHASDGQVAALRETFEDVERVMRSSSDVVEMLQANDAFYRVLLAGTGNATLDPLLAGLHARIRSLRARFLREPGRPQRAADELRRIVEAIEARDSNAAAAACEEHLSSAVRAGLSIPPAERS
jgi:DNA-binding GntR family transcriptional regulator